MITLLAVLLLLAAGAWDAYVVLWVERGQPLQSRLASGLTASYQTYVAAQTYPAIGWAFGFLSALVVLDASNAVQLAWMLISGHIFFMMRDVN